jgi:hypothetical protein
MMIYKFMSVRYLTLLPSSLCICNHFSFDYPKNYRCSHFQSSDVMLIVSPACISYALILLPYRTTHGFPRRDLISQVSSFPPFQLIFTSNPPLARSPLTEPFSQLGGNAGSSDISSAWLCRRHSAIPAVNP